MNRQQRRLRARQYEMECALADRIYQDKVRLGDFAIEAYMVCIGLAVHELWGSNKNDIIVPLIQEFNRQICRVDGTKDNYMKLAKEFEDKTGHQLVWSDSPELNK